MLLVAAAARERLLMSVCGSAEYRNIPTIPLPDEGQEADGEEEDDEDYDGWRRRPGPAEMKPTYADDAVRKRAVGNRQEEEEEDT